MKYITLKLTGFDELNTFLVGLRPKLKKAVKDEFSDGADEIIKLMRADAPRDQGQLKKSFDRGITNTTDIKIEAKVLHGAYMEFGTKSKFQAPPDFAEYAATFKGKGDSTGVKPYEMILAWVKRKKLGKLKTFNEYNVRNNRSKVKYKNRDIRDKAIAGMIWNTIKKKGVNPHPFFFSDKNGKSRTPQFTKILIQRIENALNTIISD